MRIVCLFGVVAVATVYVGCDGDSEGESGLDASVEAHPDTDGLPDAREAAVEGDVDAGLDAGGDADGASDTGPDVVLFACAPMNADSGAVFGDASCNACMSENCCDDVAACFSYDDCVARVQCVRDCDGGADCKNACKTSHPDSGTLISALGLCVNGQCGGAGCGQFP